MEMEEREEKPWTVVGGTTENQENTYMYWEKTDWFTGLGSEPAALVSFLVME